MKYLVWMLPFLFSCMKGKEADLIIHNARIHCLDDANRIEEAMAVKDGKIVEVGPERQILNKYRSADIVDAQHKDVYPGFTDAHAHLFSLAKQQLGVDLTDCMSFDEVIKRLKSYQKKNHSKCIVGRGWDQTRWKDDHMPTNTLLNEEFPSVPVVLYRIDGHALLANEALLSKIESSNVQQLNGPLETGLFIDNEMKLPEAAIIDFSDRQYQQQLVKIQQQLLAFGITGVHEAGIDARQFNILKHLVKNNKLSIDLYAMLSANEENYLLAKKIGVLNYKNLSVRSFKLYMDGALGSRGALLKEPYADAGTHYGQQLTSGNALNVWIQRAIALNYQLNVHAIGDRGNELVLKAFKQAFDRKPDHRWRIEHAQVVDPKDIHFFGDYAIFPSVQPTHATSDHDWAERRLGKKRLKGAYAYRSLYNQFGMLALGTDFPVEEINPFLTLRAAVLRIDRNNLPQRGYLINEALDLNTALRGMTIWPQFASFSESKRGLLIKGMEATFFICAKSIDEQRIPSDNFSLKTFIRGKKVYDAEDF